LKSRLRLVLAACCLCWGAGGIVPANASDSPRVEARSASYLLVGLVQGASLNLHVSRLRDNSAVRDAQVSVVVRGREYAATAQPDGGYTLSTPDLTLPGPAALEFRVTQGGTQESLRAVLQSAGSTGKEDDQSGVRQYAWWVLNFGVCIGALVLFSRRKKSADD
jgi:hypothetical protein